MNTPPFTRTFTFDETATCKRAWTFTLRRAGAGLVIEDLQVADDRRPNGEIQGCHGHPKTIAALIKGRTVGSLDAAALSAGSCPRNKSCGQILAECLLHLQSDETPA